MSDSYFVHPKAVYNYAHALVREYDDHQREQDRLEQLKGEEQNDRVE